MNVLDMAQSFEKFLCTKADGMRMPIGATIELLPVCNMDCRMCYVRMSWEEMRSKGNLRSAHEWLRDIRMAKEQGLLFVLLTGGEPLLYPEFKELYQEIKKMGLIVCINTNGTLIDEAMADFLAQDPPRRVNISIYGTSDEQYGELCGNPKGFTQMMNGVRFLKERGIPVKWNYSVTPYNVKSINEVYLLSEQCGIPVQTAYYMFPPARRRDKQKELQDYLTPEQAARVRIRAEIHDLGIEQFREKSKTMKALHDGEITIEKPQSMKSFTCRAGTSTFWLNWKGELISCGMIGADVIDISEIGFEKGWKKLRDYVEEKEHPRKCQECPYETVCVRCAAASYAEEADFTKSPQYVCELMEWYFKYIDEIEKNDSLEGWKGDWSDEVK